MLKATSRIIEPAVLYCETGWGEITRWIYGNPSDSTMRLDDNIKRCLGYIITKRVIGGIGKVVHYGTAFFVSVPSEGNPDACYIHLVVAKHVIVDKNGDLEPNLFLRLNTVNGQKKDIKLKGKWHFAKNDGIDVAVMLFDSLDSTVFDWTYIPYELPKDIGERQNVFADDEIIKTWDIGIGDELRAIGLFASRTGNQRNIPVVRSGIISAMPEEPVEVVIDEKHSKFNAYIAEMRSIGGLSGSPVFVLVESFRRPREDKSVRLLTGIGYHYFLIGMIRGHYGYKTKDIQNVINLDLKQFHSGMAFLTPIQEVLDVLYREDFVKQRKENDKKQIKDNSLGEFVEDSPKEEVFTQEDFEDALRRVSRKTSEPVSKKKETSE